MPIHLDISRLHRLVVIVARGHVSPDDIRQTTQALIDANVPTFSKIIDVSAATSDLTPQQVEGIATMLRGPAGAPARGPVAFVINPNREGFADAFAIATRDDRPIRLFRSLHEARQWVQTTPR